MKKYKIPFESTLWAGHEITGTFALMDAFFEYGYLDHYKGKLEEAIFHIGKSAEYKSNYPSHLFILYTALRSFVKACFYLQFKGKKWKVKETSEACSILHRASLTKEEYRDPFIVFQKAFDERTLDQYEFFLCEMVHLALFPNSEKFTCDPLTHYIHLTKMLDAAQLIHERGIEKTKISLE